MTMFPPRALADIRTMTAQWLVDTLQVWRGDDSELNETTLSDEHVEGTKIWEGKGRIRPTRGPREVGVAEGVAAMRDADINFELDVPELRRDDEVLVVSSEDPSLQGTWFRLTDVRVFSQQPTRKASAIQIQASRLWRTS